MAKFSVMKDMKFTPEETLDCDMPAAICTSPVRDQYPYGLRISLTEKELPKLGITLKDLAVGGMVHGHFIARITSISEDDRADGMSCRCELQIESLCLESEDEENEEEEAAAPDRTSKRRRALYGSKESA